MGHGAEAALARPRERVLEEMRRVLELEGAEAEADDATIAVRGRVAQHLVDLLWGRVPRHVGCQPHLDPVHLARLGDAVAEAFEDLLPGDSAADELERGEDALDVDGALRGRLAGVVDRDPPEVVGRAQARGDHQPDVDEVRKVGEVEEVGEALRRVRGQLDAVLLRDRDQRVRAQRPLEVDVQLDLRVAHGAHHLSSRGRCERVGG